MSFMVAIAGVAANTTIQTSGGTPANVANWPTSGTSFKGSFVYTPATTVTRALFTKVFLDFGSFTLARSDTGTKNITLINGGAGIFYTDGDSTGFTNVSLPAGGWELNEFDMTWANPTSQGPMVNPNALNFNLFTERMIFATGDNGGLPPNTLTWTVLARIDAAIALP